MSEQLGIWTIGHSNQQLEAFMSLLLKAQVGVLADIRSAPYSRYTPQFNREPLRSAVISAGFDYVFLGAELGGRPDDPSMYDADGFVLYNKVAESPQFAKGLDRLIGGARRLRVAIMCSEEDPTDCHRRLLVGRVLRDRGIDVIHIRGDGAQVDETAFANRTTESFQPALFDDEETYAWRSIRSVSRNDQPKASSSH